MGPFAPPSGGSYFSGGGLGAGGSIYGGAGGHPYLRHTALASQSPMLGPRMPGSPQRAGGGGYYGLPPVSAAGPLGGGGSGGAEAMMGMGSNAIALAQAYQTRMSALSSVAASLLSTRETMVHQLARVQSRMGEVAAAREAIEAETLADMEAVLHRLRSAEGGKFAVLQRDADVLMGDISATDAFYSALTSFQPQGPGGGGGAAPGLYDPATALAFMRAYPELCAEADRLAVKHVRGEVDVAADDFEREVAARNELSHRYAGLVDLIAAKDRIILQLLKVRGREQGIFAARAPRLTPPHTHHPISPPPLSPVLCFIRSARRAWASARRRGRGTSAPRRGAWRPWSGKRRRRWTTGSSELVESRARPLPPPPSLHGSTASPAHNSHARAAWRTSSRAS